VEKRKVARRLVVTPPAVRLRVAMPNPAARPAVTPKAAATKAETVATVPVDSAWAAPAPAALVAAPQAERRKLVTAALAVPAARPEPASQAMQSPAMAAMQVRVQLEAGVETPRRRQPVEMVAPQRAARPILAMAAPAAQVAQVEMQTLAQGPRLAVPELAVTEPVAWGPVVTAATPSVRPTVA
jgi:hypothetical protein